MARPKKTTDGEQNVENSVVAPEPAEGKTEEMVSVSKQTLESVFARMDSLEKSAKEKDEKLAMLESAADVNRIARWESQNGKRIVPKARVTFWDGAPVVGWKSLKDEVRLVGNQVIAQQTLKVFTLDSEENLKEHDLDYVQFQRSCTSHTGDIVNKEDSVEDGNTYYTVLLPEGRKVRLDIRYINAW